MNGRSRMNIKIGTGLIAIYLIPGMVLMGTAIIGQNVWFPYSQNVPQLRGPKVNVVSKATNLPTTWSLEKNIVWKTPLPSWSGGTPVIWGDRIFVTSPTKPAPANANPPNQGQT